MQEYIKVTDLINSKFCVSTEDGEYIYNILEKNISSNIKTIISFADVSLITPFFMNVSIGKLYGKFSDDEIKQWIQVNDLTDDDNRLLGYQVKRAKRYFKNPSYYNNIIKHCFEDELI